MQLVLLDKDGTICRSKSGKEFINSVDDQELYPDVEPKLAELREQGVAIGLCSNQGGAAFEIVPMAEVNRIMAHAGNLTQADLVLYCCHHPDAKLKHLKGNHPRRKPNPGMIMAACEHFGITDVGEVLFVGDRYEDKEAAERAGVDFMWAEDFFEREAS